MPEKHISPASLRNLSLFNLDHRRLSKEAIETALLLLLEEKPLAQISISELTQKAGVSRNAYYRHYASKEAILEAILRRVVRSISRRLKSFDLSKDRRKVWTLLFQECLKEASLLRQVFSQNFQELLRQCIAKRLAIYHRYLKKDATYAQHFWSGAIVSVIHQWIAEQGQDETFLTQIDFPLL